MFIHCPVAHATLPGQLKHCLQTVTFVACLQILAHEFSKKHYNMHSFYRNSLNVVTFVHSKLKKILLCLKFNKVCIVKFLFIILSIILNTSTNKEYSDEMFSLINEKPRFLFCFVKKSKTQKSAGKKTEELFIFAHFD